MAKISDNIGMEIKAFLSAGIKPCITDYQRFMFNINSVEFYTKTARNFLVKQKTDFKLQKQQTKNGRFNSALNL